MWPVVDVGLDVEGHLLERATSLDVVGSELDQLDPVLVRSTIARWPVLDMAEGFTDLVVGQADRKPGSAAAPQRAG